MTTMKDTSPQAAPRVSALERSTAMRLAADEYGRVLQAVAALGPEDWRKPTDCPAWNVHELVAHIIGMARMASSPLQQVKQQKAAARRTGDGEFIDALTAVQVELFSDNSEQRLVELLAWVGPKAARGRKRTPSLVRSRTMPVPQLVNGAKENWTIGYLVDTILTRDPWMHRIDLSHATGQELELTADHDGVIVADVVAEWAGRHGKPYQLTLTGPAGGRWSAGPLDNASALELDAIEFCRIVSGRAPGTGLLSTQVPF